MLPSYLYSPENVHKSRYAHIGVAVLAIAICVYAVLALSLDLRALRQSEISLSRLKTKATDIARQSKKNLKNRSVIAAAGDGGVELFAVRMTNWATARNVKIESLTPEGSPSTADVNVENESIGEWTSQTLRVEGNGKFEKVMEFLEQLQDPMTPSVLKSFSLQALNNGTDGSVTFQIVLTVYEKKHGVA